MARFPPPSLPWVLPFVLFVALMGLLPALGVGVVADQVIRLAVVGAALLIWSRGVMDFRVRNPVGTVLLGIGVFLLWIAPDLLIPGHRDAVLFRNPLFGTGSGGFAEAGRGDPLALGLRVARAALLVPIVEELFWRGWLPRWISDHHFERVPLGSYTRLAFWLTAVLFALEHGPWWDVGLMAGVAYNWWMIRTRSLGDCILAHAVTNACLSGYVILAGQWQYW